MKSPSLHGTWPPSGLALLPTELRDLSPDLVRVEAQSLQLEWTRDTGTTYLKVFSYDHDPRVTGVLWKQRAARVWTYSTDW